MRERCAAQERGAASGSPDACIGPSRPGAADGHDGGFKPAQGPGERLAPGTFGRWRQPAASRDTASAH
jgi:hypothetical protein